MEKALPKHIETILINLVEADMLDDRSAKIVKENYFDDPHHYDLLLDAIRGETPLRRDAA